MNLPPLRSGDGCGNSFVLVAMTDLQGGPWESAALWPALAQRACAQGVDGLLMLGEEQADGALPVRIVNRDGSDGGACLNGLRVAACAGGRARGVFLMAGRRVPWRREAAGVFTLDLGSLAEARLRPVSVAGRDGVAVDFWNPHVVFAVGEPGDFPLSDLAAACAARPDFFPQGVNVEIVNDWGADPLRARVCERGVGETLACGSGAVAVALAAWQRGRQGPLAVRMPGGILRLRRTLDGVVELAGEAGVSDLFVNT